MFSSLSGFFIDTELLHQQSNGNKESMPLTQLFYSAFISIEFSIFFITPQINQILILKFKHFENHMFSSGFKQPFHQPSQTLALSSINQALINKAKTRPISSKKDTQLSILQKLNSSKFKNIEHFDISYKIILPHDSRSKYFVFNQNINSESHQIKNHNQPYKYSQANEKALTLSPIKLKHQQTEPINNLKVFNQQKEYIINRNSSRQRFLNPTQSWIGKITPQKHSQKGILPNQSKVIHQKEYQKEQKQNFVPISIHQQLYLESRKKLIKKSAERIIENQYFKKIHPFKPEVSEVSQFLAQQRHSKIKNRNNFEKQFAQFSQRSSKSSSSQKSKKPSMDKNSLIQGCKRRQNELKQTQLKNYTLLKQFFFYLSQNSAVLSYSNLTPKKLCELPSACLNLLEPILEQFYKNKKTRRLEWLQFLSEFNLKIQKRKTFYSLIEKWFWIKYKLRFDSKSKASFVQEEKSKKDKNLQNSTLQPLNSSF